MWQALLCILGLISAQDDVVFHTNFDLNDSLQRMRQRYSLMYRALTGYKAGIPGSEARQQMSLK